MCSLTVDDTDLKIQYAQARRALQDLTSPSAIADAKAGIATAESDLTSAIQHLAYIISPNVLHWEDEIKKAQAALEDAQAAADASPTDKDAQTALVIAKAGLEHAQAGLKGAQYSYTETYIKNNFTVTRMDQSSHHMIKYVAEPSEADILEARAAVAEAQAGVTEANDLYAALTGGELPDDATGDSLTQLEQARLDVDDAKSQLDGASIVATIPGTVMSVNTSVGETANSGTTMMTISDLSQPYLQVFLDESDWSNVKVGAEADITFDILPDETFTGKVMQVDPGLYTEGNSSVVRALRPARRFRMQPGSVCRSAPPPPWMSSARRPRTRCWYRSRPCTGRKRAVYGLRHGEWRPQAPHGRGRHPGSYQCRDHIRPAGRRRRHHRHRGDNNERERKIIETWTSPRSTAWVISA